VTDTWDDEDRAIAAALGMDAPGAGAGDPPNVDAYRNVVAHLPFDEIAPPPDLEERVVAAALAKRAPGEPRRPTIASLDRARARRRSVTRIGALVAATAAAVIAVVALANSPESAPSKVSGRIEPVAANVVAVLRDPPAGTRIGAFDRSSRVFLLPDGRGYIQGVQGAPVVWIDSARASLRLGPATVGRDGVIAFTVNHPGLVTAVRLTTREGVERGRAVLTTR
jgi:hypothetical protein